MISHVTKNRMMQNENFMKSMEKQQRIQKQQQQQQQPVVEVEEDEELEEEDYDTLNPRTKDLNFNLNVSLKDFILVKKKISIRRKRMKKLMDIK